MEGFGRAFLGFWGIFCWIIGAWFSLIDFVLGLLGWFSIIISMYFLFTGQLLPGSIIYIIALGFLVCREICGLASFWLSGRKYVMSPEAFVGDIIGAAIGFFMLFGMLFGFWYFLYPVQWLFIISVALIPITILSAVSRFTRNFIAMLKSKMTGTP